MLCLNRRRPLTRRSARDGFKTGYRGIKQYTKINKRDYLALLDKLVEKYSTDEAAVIHAALLKKCQAGDMDAIRLWTELQKESGSGAAEVNIIDGI